MNEKLSAFGVVPVVVIDDAKDALPLAEALQAGSGLAENELKRGILPFFLF